MELSDFQWLFSLGPAGGFVALFWMTLKFFGSSQKDATDAALELYRRVNERCTDCENQVTELRQENSEHRARIAELEQEIFRMNHERATRDDT